MEIIGNYYDDKYGTKDRVEEALYWVEEELAAEFEEFQVSTSTGIYADDVENVSVSLNDRYLTLSMMIDVHEAGDEYFSENSFKLTADVGTALTNTPEEYALDVANDLLNSFREAYNNGEVRFTENAEADREIADVFYDKFMEYVDYCNDRTAEMEVRQTNDVDL